VNILRCWDVRLACEQGASARARCRAKGGGAVHQLIAHNPGCAFSAAARACSRYLLLPAAPSPRVLTTSCTTQTRAWRHWSVAQDAKVGLQCVEIDTPDSGEIG
jgi:hypothetical protein